MGTVPHSHTKEQIQMSQHRNQEGRHKSIQTQVVDEGNQTTAGEQPEFLSSSSASVLYDGNQTNHEGNTIVLQENQKGSGGKQNTIDTPGFVTKTPKNELIGDLFQKNEPGQDTGGCLE